MTPKPSISSRVTRFVEGAVDRRDDIADMIARGQLGDDAPVFFVHGNLAGDSIGQNTAAVFDDGRRGFVAAGLDGEYASMLEVLEDGADLVGGLTLGLQLEILLVGLLGLAALALDHVG